LSSIGNAPTGRAIPAKLSGEAEIYSLSSKVCCPASIRTALGVTALQTSAMQTLDVEKSQRPMLAAAMHLLQSVVGNLDAVSKLAANEGFRNDRNPQEPSDKVAKRDTNWARGGE
jgi:hypothetical protein